MSTWRKLSENDLIATLSRAEVDAFRSDFEVDAVERLLADTAAWARGYIRSNGNVKLSPNDDELPASCITPATDYAAYKILKRRNLIPNEARTKAYDDAVEFFKDVAAGRINPESYLADSSDPTGGACAVVITNSRERVSAHKLEGL